MELKGQHKTIPIGQLSKTISGMQLIHPNPMGFHPEEMPRMAPLGRPRSWEWKQGEKEEEGEVRRKEGAGQQQLIWTADLHPSVNLVQN